MELKLAEIAARHGCELLGDPDAVVTGVAGLTEAREGALSFLSNRAFRRHLPLTRATAVIVTPDDAQDCPVNALVCPDPYVLYALVARELYPEQPLQPGVHPSAHIGDEAVIPASCEVGPGAVIGRGVRLGERVYIGPNCVIGDDTTIDDDSRLYASVTLYQGVSIGKRNRLNAGVVIGADGFGIARSHSGWIKVPQLGSVVTGDDVEIGANSAVDRGAIDDTCLGNDVRLDNHVHIGHNVRIGDHTAIAGFSGVAGSTEIGARCLIGGAAAIGGHLKIVDDVILMGRASVPSSITSSGTYSSVLGVEEAGLWRRLAARFKRLDDMARRIKRLEKLAGNTPPDKE